MAARGFDAFADEVVPILQSRGLFRTEYSGRTLREHFGLARPASQYSRGRHTPGQPAPSSGASTFPASRCWQQTPDRTPQPRFPVPPPHPLAPPLDWPLDGIAPE
ncbi:hypothetical protein [Arthrobacter sp. Leaf137]|uniref:hypothetical protein n=1 Tax=Arthrobacter sp. Leaf137 TaxID=1736271 RepID=UPI0006F9B44E|nr:hypothetical protein [Arthrobacter sp. Leaf137]KQQ88780.1 hypothetical protein ASF64_18275 [Arthrobacter sp. Leaf137]